MLLGHVPVGGDRNPVRERRPRVGLLTNQGTAGRHSEGALRRGRHLANDALSQTSSPSLVVHINRGDRRLVQTRTNLLL